VPFKISRYGWLPQHPDKRDQKFRLAQYVPLPDVYDLEPDMPPIYNQGNAGSCTGNGIAACVQAEQIEQKEPDIFVPSRLFIYYNERVMEGTADSDSGANIRDGLKSVGSIGACPEEFWPYDESKVLVKPSDEAYAKAPLGKALKYRSVDQYKNLMQQILAQHTPIVLGVTLYDSFESDEVARTGEVPMPKIKLIGGESVVGGHCVVLVGYDERTQRWKLRNSWGTAWGRGGYFTMPYAYLLDGDLASDFWAIELVA
jgi:C1A family cysteine protease